MVAGDDEFEFCGDGGEHSEGFAEGGYATDAAKVAAVEENVGFGGGEVEGEDRCRGGGEVVGVRDDKKSGRDCSGGHGGSGVVEN